MGQIYRRAEQYLDQLDPECIGQFVEIGTSRNGDDGSTPTIAGWAKRFDRRLWTVDIDPDNCDFVCRMNLDNVEIVNQSGEEFLKKFPAHNDSISFLYLDNFDWDWHPEKPEDFVLEQKQRYRMLGQDMTNLNSQRAHLAQIVAATLALGKQCLVVCDDTWYNRWWGHYSGKSGAAIPYLLNLGFTVLETEEQPVYGTILGRGIG